MPRLILVALIAAAGLACPNGNGPGANEPPPPEEDATLTPVLDVPPPMDTTLAPEPVGEPGTLKVSASFNAEPVVTTVEVRRRGEQEIVAQVQLDATQTEQEISLPPGQYDLRATFPGAIDAGGETRDGLRIQSGRVVRHQFAFDGISAVTLECNRGGRSVQGKVRLRRPGMEEWLPEVRCGDEFYIQGGGYEAEITIGSGRSGAIITVPELQIVGGGRVRTPVNIN